MHIKILLPYKVFADIPMVKKVVFETSKGAYGLLPNRLDCTAAIVPGILTYEDNSGVTYIALDKGILVKKGYEVLISVRNAVGGADLGKLKASVEKEFNEHLESEKNVRSAMAKLESGFIHNLEKFLHS